MHVVGVYVILCNLRKPYSLYIYMSRRVRVHFAHVAPSLALHPSASSTLPLFRWSPLPSPSGASLSWWRRGGLEVASAGKVAVWAWDRPRLSIGKPPPSAEALHR